LSNNEIAQTYYWARVAFKLEWEPVLRLSTEPERFYTCGFSAPLADGELTELGGKLLPPPDAGMTISKEQLDKLRNLIRQETGPDASGPGLGFVELAELLGLEDACWSEDESQ
jgi:hypothetical protein